MSHQAGELHTAPPASLRPTTYDHSERPDHRSPTQDPAPILVTPQVLGQRERNIQREGTHATNIGVAWKTSAVHELIESGIAGDRERRHD